MFIFYVTLSKTLLYLITISFSIMFIVSIVAAVRTKDRQKRNMALISMMLSAIPATLGSAVLASRKDNQNKSPSPPKKIINKKPIMIALLILSIIWFIGFIAFLRDNYLENQENRRYRGY